MATHKIRHGETGSYIEATVTDRDGSIPDFAGATLQIEVYYKGQQTNVILDATPTSPSVGVLRYTFVAGDWATIANLRNDYSLIWWATRAGVTTSYPDGTTDTLEVWPDPQGVPGDVSEIAYLTVAAAAATYLTIEDAAPYLSETTAALTYYVNAATGSDANTGLSADAAFLTIQKAIDAIPLFVKHAVVVNVAAVTHTENPEGTKIVDPAGSITIQGTLSAFTPATGIASGTIASYSTRTATVTAAGWTTNDLRDKLLRTTADGELYAIASNTATTVEVAYASGSLAGKAFDIVEPGTIVNGGTDAGDVAFLINQIGIGEEIFSPLTEAHVGLIIRNIEIVAHTCVRSSARVKLYGCRLKYNEYGVLLEQGQAAQVFRSVILEQSALGGAGVNSAWSQFLDVAGCYLRGATGGAGVRAEGTNYFDVSSSGNVVEGHTYGYLIYDVLGAAEHYSLLRGNTYGLLLGGKTTVNLLSTVITGNGTGVYQLTSSNVGTGSVSIGCVSCTISSNTGTGVHLNDYASMKMEGATLTGNGAHAIEVAGAHCSVEAYGSTNISSNVVFGVKAGYLAAFTNIYVASSCTMGSNGADFTLDNEISNFSRAVCTAAANHTKIDAIQAFNRVLCP